jgi:hypothetical protein
MTLHLNSRFLRVLPYGVGIIGGLLCIPGIVVGGMLTYDWIRLKTHSLMYFDYRYAASGLLWLCISLAGMIAAACTLSRRVFYGILPLMAVAIGLVATLSVPEVNPRVEMMTRATSLLGHADRSLALWDEAHGSFPESDVELLNALSERPLSEARIFGFGSERLPYQVKLIANAVGPYMQTPPDQPGVFVYAVRGDFQEYWLTMTTLDEPVGGRVVYHRAGGDYKNGKLWVINRTHRRHQKGFIE